MTMTLKEEGTSEDLIKEVIAILEYQRNNILGT